MLTQRHICRALLALLVSGFSLAQSYAQTALSEGQLKAALVLNFARYIEWPENALGATTEPANVCMIGRDTLGGALSSLETKLLYGRAIKVKIAMTIEDTRGCHVLFISESEERRLVPILKSLADKPVLTVSDISGFAESGGAIGIVQGETRLQFEVNRKTLDTAKLKASSNLLKLAKNLSENAGKN